MMGGRLGLMGGAAAHDGKRRIGGRLCTVQPPSLSLLFYFFLFYCIIYTYIYIYFSYMHKFIYTYTHAYIFIHTSIQPYMHIYKRS